MKPYESEGELLARLTLLERSLTDARHIRWKLQQSSHEVDPIADVHFDIFEEVIKREIEEIRFHLELENILSGK